MKTFLTLAIFSLLSCSCMCEQSYIVQNEAFEPFKGLEETCVDMSKLKTVQRQRLLNGTVQFCEDMDSDTFKLQVELFSSPNSDGNYKRLPFGVPITGVCEVFKGLYTQIVQPALINGENTDFPHVPDDGLCPIPATEYFVTNIAFNTEEWPSEIPRGTLKAVVTFFKNNVNVGGAVMKMKIEDRQ